MDTNTLQVRDATPEEHAEWFETDFFMKGEFSAMQLFVVIPAIVQFVVLGTMLVSFAIIDVLF